MSTAVDARADILQSLANHSLLSAAALVAAKAFQGGPRELLAQLVEKKHLTRFQADAVLRGGADQLTLSTFTLVDVLGSGAMGQVYKAKSSRDGGWYAIKTAPRKNVINLKAIGEKVEALKQVRHPRVSAMVHIGAQGDRVYMVWPLLEGGASLDAILKKQGKLGPKQAAQVALQVASGLQAYHQHDLFHGLLKASDILIGADRRVRILDFGVGFLLTCERGKAVLSTMTNGQTLAKGLDCAAPETIVDPLARTPRGDQYSLGCVLYYCLTGQYPFPDANPVKKMLGHQFEQPTPLLELAPEAPPRLEAIVNRLMAKTPEERYATTDELVAELQAAASDSRPMPMPAAPAAKKNPTTPLPPAKPVAPSAVAKAQEKRQPEPEPAPEPEQPEEAPAPAPAKPARSRKGLWLALAGIAAGLAVGFGAGVATWFLKG
jgi:serine/threonine protein kinase